MNVLGIIAEYNPLHNGHVYHIEEARKKANADYVVIIMSGSFTQQGNIGVLNKFQRATLAIEAGADLVIELPTIYATSSSESFSSGAVNILDSLGCITHIAFGSECSSVDVLNNIAKKILDMEHEIIHKISKRSKEGLSSPKANGLVLKDILSADEYDEIDKSNNILAIEYLKCMNRIKSKIKPLVIERKNSLHGDDKIDNSSLFASSSAIRNEIDSNPEYIVNISKSVPSYTLEMLSKNTVKTNENIYSLLKYKILSLGKEGLKDIKEISEGLENRFYDLAHSAKTYQEFIHKVKCKRYTLGRIKRICINILLGITKDLDDSIQGVKYAKILKVNKKSIELLGILSNSTIPVITSINEKKTNTLDKKVQESLSLDILATNISEINGNIGLDYTNNIT